MAYLENTRTFIEEDQLEEARVEATKAKALFQELRDTQHMAEALYLESRVYALQGKFEAAADQGAQAQRYAQRAGDLELEYQINNILSWSYFSLGQSFSENLAHQERQLAVVGRLDDNAAKALVYNNYGYDATVAGTVPLDTAVRYSGWANQYYARTEGHQGRWYTLMNLTWQYRLQNKLTESEQWGRLALRQAQSDADRHAIIEAATNLGETLLAAGKIAEARPVYETAKSWAERAEDRDGHVFSVYHARYLWETGRREAATDTLRKAIAFLETSEIFYEMLARAWLAYYSQASGDTETVDAQLAVFQNPRANYYSQEAKVIAGIAEAKRWAQEDPERSLAVLGFLEKDLQCSGAKRLMDQVQQVKNSF